MERESVCLCAIVNVSLSPSLCSILLLSVSVALSFYRVLSVALALLSHDLDESSCGCVGKRATHASLCVCVSFCLYAHACERINI